MPEVDRYAVFGHPVGHSKSPQIHKQFAQQTGQSGVEYTAEDVSPEAFDGSVAAFFRSGGKGLNCTVPLKERAFALANANSERAALCGAVNTLALREDGTVFGDNTDGIGLVNDLGINLGIDISGLRILVLGAGGACRGILGPILEQRPASLMIANRTERKAEDLAGRFSGFGNVSGGGFAQLSGSEFDLVINSTSASLSNQLPELPQGVLRKSGWCYDLAYADHPTAFVRWGYRQQATVSADGLGMLVEQAAEAFLIWRGIRPRTGAVIRSLELQRRNFSSPA